MTATIKPHGIQWLNGHKTPDGTPMQGESWNPVTGCTHAGSPGCDNCYAKRDYGRWNPDKAFEEVTFHADRLDKPLHWKKPRAVFVNSMSDLFHESVSFEQIAAILGVMAASPQHRYFVLTKRVERMEKFFEWLEIEAHPWNARHYLPDGKEIHPRNLKNMPNVVWGVTAENQEQADKRIPVLLELKATGMIKFAMVSVEPMLGAVDLTRMAAKTTPIFTGYGNSWISALGDPAAGASLDWVIVGGESGPNARPMHPDWVRSLRDQCANTGTPFFFKQWGTLYPFYERAKDGECWPCSYDARLNLAGGCGFNGVDVVYFRRLFKKSAGCLLDGREHKELIRLGEHG